MEMHPEILVTERLKLIKITPDVFTYIFENLSDDKAAQFIGMNRIEDLHREKERYKNGISTFNKKFLYFHIIDKATDTLMGWAGFHTWYLDHRRAELGYQLFDDAFKQRGFMKEALIPVIRYGFSSMDLHRIEAFVSLENIPSLRLLQYFNFTQEGLLREHYQKNGIMEDSAVFSLLKKEYK